LKLQVLPTLKVHGNKQEDLQILQQRHHNNHQLGEGTSDAVLTAHFILKAKSVANFILVF
jgi:hypothetical protein